MARWRRRCSPSPTTRARRNGAAWPPPSSTRSGPEAARSPAGAPLALAAQRLAATPVVAELAGTPGDARAGALARAVVAARGPLAVVRWRAGTAAPCVTVQLGARAVPALTDPAEVCEMLRYTDEQ